MIIPIYGKINYTLNCLASIAIHPPKVPFEIIVIDDRSPDNSVEVLEQVKGIRVIINEHNQGFIKSCNAGAKAAKVGEFMKIMVKDCYDATNQKIFAEGMDALKAKDFMGLDAAKKKELLITLDKEQKEYTAKKKPEDPAHYFKLMKDLTLQGFFTSEVGATQALRYVPIPGKYDGCMPYKKGDKAWAT